MNKTFLQKVILLGRTLILILLVLLFAVLPSSANIDVAETTISAEQPTSGTSSAANAEFSSIGYYTWTAPYTGTYQFEAWGADGGDAWETPGHNRLGIAGGKGAYTKGKISLQEGDVVFVYVGGKGTNGVRSTSSTNYVIEGGWNGGGNGHQDGNNDDCGGAGGGATDFRIISGGALWNNLNSLQSRIMVAAGGGGATTTSNTSTLYLTGYGGGTDTNTIKLSGFSGYYEAYISNSGSYTYNGGPSLLYELGTFGQGGNGTGTQLQGGGGGGGGWYGGIAGHDNVVNDNWVSRGSGGTSYISGYPGLSTYTNNGKAYSFTDYVMISGDDITSSVNNGDGLAKITLLEIDIETENVSVRKNWSDDNNSDGFRSPVCLQLLESGQPTCHTVQINTLADSTQYIFSEISDGNYSVRETGATCNIDQLPAGYQRVEYIESTGTQWIDTGVTANKNTGFDVDFIIYDTGTGWRSVIAAYGSEQRQLELNMNGNGISYLYYIHAEDDFTGSRAIPANYQADTRTNVSLRYQTYTDPNGIATTITMGDYSTDVSMFVFGRNYQDTITELSSTRLYSLKLYDGNIEIRNFIPCYRLSDGEIGLYDTVNGVFYTNQGTGKFFKGLNCISAVISN